jgi:hypothetical protein
VSRESDAKPSRAFHEIANSHLGDDTESTSELSTIDDLGEDVRDCTELLAALSSVAYSTFDVHWQSAGPHPRKQGVHGAQRGCTRSKLVDNPSPSPSSRHCYHHNGFLFVFPLSHR